MCLGVPGKVTRVEDNPLGMAMGEVDFGGVLKDVCLAYVPEVRVGDYVVVHAGFAISQVDEAEAAEILDLLEQIAAVGEAEAASQA